MLVPFSSGVPVTIGRLHAGHPAAEQRLPVSHDAHGFSPTAEALPRALAVYPDPR